MSKVFRFSFTKAFNNRVEVIWNDDNGFYIGLPDEETSFGPLTGGDLVNLNALIWRVIASKGKAAIKRDDGRNLSFYVETENKQARYCLQGTGDYTLGHTVEDVETLANGCLSAAVTTKEGRTILWPITFDNKPRNQILEYLPQVLPGRVSLIGLPLRYNPFTGTYTDGLGPHYDQYGRPTFPRG